MPVKFSSVKSSQIQFDHTGPFEPLLLSSDGELPLVQVSGSNPPGANYLCVGQVHTEPCSGFNWASASGQWD